jgi:hypothetical protein
VYGREDLANECEGRFWKCMRGQSARSALKDWCANERAGNGKCMEKRRVGSVREGRVGKVVEGSVWEVYGKGVVWELYWRG